MKKNVIRLSMMVVLGVVLVAVSGCNCCQKQQCERVDAAVETVSSKNVEILWADVQHVNDKLVVHGMFKRAHAGGVPMKAHLDVQVLGEDQQMIEQIQGEEMYVPANRVAKGLDAERFVVELGHVPAEASKIVVTAHQGVHDQG